MTANELRQILEDAIWENYDIADMPVHFCTDRGGNGERMALSSAVLNVERRCVELS